MLSVPLTPSLSKYISGSSQSISLFLVPDLTKADMAEGSTLTCKKADTLNSAYNEKKYAEILLCYRQLFVKADVFIGQLGIFGAEVFLHYRQFFC